MKARAEHVGQTRQRIVDAAVQLHGSIGPAATTIAAIADLAQVTRLTVYRHFPDEAALFEACSGHWLSQQQLPDPASWCEISEPADRLRAGLADLYRFYRAGADMLTRIYHDLGALPQVHRRRLAERDRHHRDVLAAPFATGRSQRRRVRAIIGHAASFWTWHSLCVEQGLTHAEAIEIMTGAVRAALATPAQPENPSPAPRD
jgi:AcrR family transcriptional regulator